MINRIEELGNAVTGIVYNWQQNKIKTKEERDRLICQLFPQPLEDEELREKALLIDREIEALVKEHEKRGTDGYMDVLRNRWRYFLPEILKAQQNKDFALLQPKMEEAIKQERERILGKDRPKIVCLCGSTKFKDAFTDAQLRETLNGHIVLTIGCNMRTDTEIFGHLSQEEFNETKIKLDELHKRKIDLADEVMILNVGGYIGNSTRAELEYAKSKGKSIKYLEAPEESG